MITDKRIQEQVNKINEDFYKIISSSFDQTRQYSWDAWEKIVPEIFYSEQKKIKVLDLGCGNGRFAKFLFKKKQKDNNLEYTGIDSSSNLLELGQKSLSEISDKNFSFKLVEQNILDDDFSFGEENFDLVVLFGVMHHLYSWQIRKKLFKKINQALKENGKFIFTTWQFINNSRQQKKILDLQSQEGAEFLNQYDLSIENFEKNDYILSWERKAFAYRYCHHYEEEEIKKLANDTGFKITKSFFGDGKEGNLNQYFVLEKNKK